MNVKEFKRRFMFVPVICAVIYILLVICRLITSSGIMKFDFASLDEKYIPEIIEPAETTGKKNPLIPKTKVDGNGNIDINHASVEELDTIPGIGEKRAGEIVNQREIMGGFTTLDDIRCTKGIGVETYNKIKPYIKITAY